jgi:hypothetical protein
VHIGVPAQSPAGLAHSGTPVSPSVRPLLSAQVNAFSRGIKKKKTPAAAARGELPLLPPLAQATLAAEERRHCHLGESYSLDGLDQQQHWAGERARRNELTTQDNNPPTDRSTQDKTLPGQTKRTKVAAE